MSYISKTQMTALSMAVIAVALLGLVTVMLPSPRPATLLAPTLPLSATEQDSACAIGREPVEPPCGEPAFDAIYAAPAGSRFSFRITGDAETSMRRSDGVENGMAFTYAAGLELVVSARRDGELLLELELVALTIDPTVRGSSVDRAATVALIQELEHAVAVRMRDDGQTLGFRFHPQVGPEARNWFRGLVAGLRFVVPPGAGAQWETEETDPTGRHATAYCWQPSTGERVVGKRKLRYLPAATDPVPLVESSGQARCRRALGWLASGSCRERLELDLGELGIVVHQSSRLSFELEAHGFGMPVAAEAAELAWQAPWLSVDARADAAELTAVRQRARWSALLEGVTVHELVAEIAVLAQSERLDTHDAGELVERLSWLIRLQPEVLAPLRSLVVEPGLPSSALVAVLGAVAEAQIAPGQELLARLLGDAAMDERVRWAACLASASLERPLPAVLSAVSAVLVEEAPASLRRTTLLVLGALASRPSCEDGTTPALDRLLAYEERARRDGRLDTWLEALGNTGHAIAIDPARRCLRHQDESVRLAAVSTLRKITTPAAAAMLCAALEQDTSPAVRAHAAELLVAHATPAVFDCMAGLLAREPELEVRHAAIAALGRLGAKVTRAAALLRAAASNDPAPELRALAARLGNG